MSLSKSEKESQSDGNIQTFLRIRPSAKPSGFFNIDELDADSLKISLPDNFRSDYVNNSKLRHTFHFNGIIDMPATQEEVFKRVGVLAVRNALDGFNSTIFAYGQTGSGKTFTLTGGPEKYSDRGIIPRSISMIFNEVRTRTDAQYKVYISYLEIYNEQGFDLLDPSHETKKLEDLPKVSMLEDEHGNFHLKNLSMHLAETEEDALELLFMGDTNRAIAETPMNMASSRSHCIFSISMECRPAASDLIRRSKLHLVDLAGSERVGKTNSTGSVLTEAKYINSSLFFLEMVIVALYEKATKGRSHIPYRNSMMTSVLRDSLGGNCKTIMVATINPESAQTEESLSTCRFAQRVSLIKNKASINEDVDPSLVIRRLKTEILSLREEIAFLKGESGEGDALSQEAIETLKAQCRQYCDDTDPYSTLNIGSLTLTKIKDAFAIMKNLVLESRAAAGGGGVKSIGDGDDGRGGIGSDEQQAKAIRDLKSLLMQRDKEIEILVNMVKKGKTSEDVELASRGSNRSRLGNGEDDLSEEGRSGRSYSGRGGGADLEGSGRTKAKPSIIVMQQQQQQLRIAAKEEKILKRHLFGVPPPADQAVFDDAAASFEWFRERCSLNAAMEENRELLKNKINEAKTLGERVNQSRATINYLKNSIEAIRRERALHRIDKDGKSSGDDEHTKEEEEEESPEEQTYRRAIEQEKMVYKEGFERLRVLKPEIENIRKMLEKGRMNMQTQFDQWYSNLHARGGAIGATAGGAGAHESVYFHQEQQQLEQQLMAAHNQTRNSNGLSRSSALAGAEVGGALPKRPMGSNDDSNTSLLSSRELSHKYDDSNSSILSSNGAKGFVGAAEADAKSLYPSPSASAAFGSALPSQTKQVTDDPEVNEDIMAFYQAREELLKRRVAK